MTEFSPLIRTLSAGQLGGPGAPDTQACSSSAMALLNEAAGPGMRIASLSLDVSSHALGHEEVEVAVRVEKRARSIVFASVEARAGGRLVYSAQGLFSRAG